MIDLTERRPEVPGYTIVGELGRGGFAIVYEADQLSVGRRVALKVLSMSGLSPDDEKRFRSELRTVGLLSWHPHVVALHDAGITPAGLPYMAMELVPGGSWADRVADGPCPADAVLTVGIQIANALAAAHAEGIIHRDVKPENVLVGRGGEAVLADFGVATVVDGSRSLSGGFRGTLLYAAPELLRGTRADARSDLYALGATLYTLAAGRAAFGSDDDETPLAIISRVQTKKAPPLPAGVPDPLVSAIERAMASEPQNRPASAAEFEAQLREALSVVERGPDADRPGPVHTSSDSEPSSPDTPGATTEFRPGPPPPVGPRPPVGGAVPAADRTPPPTPRPAAYEGPSRSTPFPPPPSGPVSRPAEDAAQEADRLASLPPPPTSTPSRPTPGADPYRAPDVPRDPAATRSAPGGYVTTPLTIPVPVYQPVPIAPTPVPGQVQGQQSAAPGVWSSTWHSVVASLLCCAPVGLFYAVQAHRRMIFSGGRLRQRGSKGRLMVASAYAWTLAMAVLVLSVPASAYLDARADTGRFAGHWVGGRDGLTMEVTLAQTTAGLDLEGTFDSTNGDQTCTGTYTSADVDGDSAKLKAEGTCDPPLDHLPETVRASLSADGETLTVVFFGSQETALRKTD